MPATPRFVDALLRAPDREERVLHTHTQPARDGRRAPWPTWADPDVVAGYRARGVDAPWEHQAEAAQLAWEGHHTVLATSTGSGKSLAFWLPALSAVRADAASSVLDPGRIETVTRRGSVLYLCPTKALAADQLRGLEALLDAGHARDVRVSTCDGDTATAERRWVQDYADVVLTNPDFLHFALLPQHRRWARLLGGLRFVVVDECHAYRGLFGAHVSLVLRRLSRLAAHYRPAGAPPLVFLLASATTADPAASAARLVGVTADEVRAVTEDASPAGRRTFLMWQPPLLPGVRPDAAAPDDSLLLPAAANDPWETTPPASLGSPGAPGSPGADLSPDEVWAVDAAPRNEVRRSAAAETAHLLTDLVLAGARTLAFTRSRRGAEQVAQATRDHLQGLGLGPDGDDLAGRVAAYRGGYLPEERRALEQAIGSGALRALATTNALELGVDISGLDAVLIAGWPGTRVSLWQQAGRAGRAGADGLVVLVAREDPLDTYLVHHPEAVLDEPVEATVFDPTNPYVLAPHLCAAAAELPLKVADLAAFGETARPVLDTLVTQGALRKRASGWYWTHEQQAARLTDLRGAGGRTINVVEASTGRMLGTVDRARAHATVHPGAVYIHQGVQFVVADLIEEDAVALVHREDVDYATWARWSTSIDIRNVREETTWGEVTWAFGDVDVHSQVLAFDRKRLPDLMNLGTEELDLPATTLTTTAVWWTAPASVLAAAQVDAEHAPGALHAAEHASIGLLPLLATCDRWDLGGVSTALHLDTEQATVFVHDAFPGGAGFAERGFRLGAQWLRATRDAIAECPCAEGCPACVQSPKCGNGNNPLEKAAAVRLLNAVLAAAPGAP